MRETKLKRYLREVHKLSGGKLQNESIGIMLESTLRFRGKGYYVTLEELKQSVVAMRAKLEICNNKLKSFRQKKSFEAS